MYKLLIVDDKPYEREGLANTIDWQDIDIEVCGTCSDGEEALEFVQTAKPDIILSDIVMPGLNGIQLAETVKELYPDTRFVFMSCYNEFDYAQSAIHLRANGYVLKPLDLFELKGMVSKIVHELEAERLQKSEKELMKQQILFAQPVLKEQLIRDILMGTLKDIKEIDETLRLYGIDIPMQKPYRIAFARIKYSAKNDSVAINIEDKYLVAFSVKKLIASSAYENVIICSAQISSEELALLIINECPDANHIDKKTIMDLLTGFCEEIERKLGMAISFGVSKTALELDLAPKMYKQSTEAISTRFTGSKNPIMFFEDIEDLEYISFDKQVELEVMSSEMKRLITDEKEEIITSFLHKYLGNNGEVLTEEYVKSFSFTVVNMLLVTLLERGKSFKDVFGDEFNIWNSLAAFDRILDIGEWLSNIITAVRNNLNEIYCTGKNKTVEVIQDYIHKNYNRPISVNDISREVFLSTRYCNEIFKKATGMTIFDYLTEHRFKMARKLLQEPDSKIAAVAQLVGYENVSHFCLLFKRFVGATPSEFKKRPF